jgi:hypothetical protein
MIQVVTGKISAYKLTGQGSVMGSLLYDNCPSSPSKLDRINGK